jgi:hypothetical protein
MKRTLKFTMLSLNLTCACLSFQWRGGRGSVHNQHDGIHCNVPWKVMRVNSKDVMHPCL